VLFNGALALANRESGKVLTILLWQSEDASHWYRHYSAEAADDKVTSVERYEVLYSEIEEAHPWPPRSDLRSGSLPRCFYRSLPSAWVGFTSDSGISLFLNSSLYAISPILASLSSPASSPQPRHPATPQPAPQVTYSRSRPPGIQLT
jgi:hypothetical protein